MEKLIVKGDNPPVESTLKAYFTGDILHLEKGFLGLMLSKKQAIKLKEFIEKENNKMFKR